MNLTKFKSKPLLLLAALMIIAVAAAAVTPLPQNIDPTPGKAVEVSSDNPPVSDNAQAKAVKNHAISEGDTLEGIAVKYNIDVDTILGANPTIDENNLQIGDQLIILPSKGVIHTADMGDTLWSIANDYSIDIAAIMAANAKTSEALAIDEKLFVPGGKPLPKAETVVARADYQVSRSSASRFLWPAGGSISSQFGYRWGRLHAGIDIADDIGTPVVAAMAGRVVSTNWQSGYGYTVVIEHSRGYETLYGHLSEFAVSSGQYVRAGQTVAYMGNTGYSTGPHLHFEVHQGGRVIDPLNVLP